MSDYPPPPPPPPPQEPWGQQPTGQPPQGAGYGQQPYQPYQPYQGYATGPPPSNNLVWAIISLFCCTIGGIVAIVYAAQVDGKWARGDYAGAQQSAKNARTWAIVSIGVGLAISVIYILIFVATGLNAGTSEF